MPFTNVSRGSFSCEEALVNGFIHCHVLFLLVFTDYGMEGKPQVIDIDEVS